MELTGLALLSSFPQPRLQTRRKVIRPIPKSFESFMLPLLKKIKPERI
jgi:hypothetical protein